MRRASSHGSPKSIETMMKSCIIFIICIVITISIASRGVVSLSLHDCNYTAGNYTSNSTYATSLTEVLNSLERSASLLAPFDNTSSGDTGKVYGQYYCRGNIDPNTCSDCIKGAAEAVVSQCPNAKSATMMLVSEPCTLQYSNHSMFNREGPGLGIWIPGTENMTAAQEEKFPRVYNDTMDRLIRESAYGEDRRRLAEGTAELTENSTLYCQAQCSPDLSGPLCEACLMSVKDLESLNISWSRVSVYGLYSNCWMMYNITTRFDYIAGNTKKQSIAVYIAVLVVVVSLVLLSIGCFWVYKKKKLYSYENMDELENAESLQFDISTIRMATSNFSDASKLGQGGFGSVYKGRLQNGQEIAVKRLFQKSKGGVEEFKTEVVVVAKLQHRNLVKLLGYCLTGREKILIFELLPNSSLDHFLYDATKRASLNWKARYNIIVGIARGLSYLHEESRLKIIHRDLKPQNILLDENMNPKIGDFGLAKSFNLDQSMANTHNIVGTYGYMSPEYAMAGHFSAKSDVYSFGVIVLEIVTGKRNITQENQPSLFHHSWKLWTEGKSLDLVDPALEDYSKQEAMACIHIGLLCIQEDPGSRPAITKVVTVLNGHFTALPQPSPPLIFSFTEGASGIKCSSALATHSSQGECTSEQNYSTRATQNSDLHSL